MLGLGDGGESFDYPEHPGQEEVPEAAHHRHPRHQEVEAQHKHDRLYHTVSPQRSGDENRQWRLTLSNQIRLINTRGRKMGKLVRRDKTLFTPHKVKSTDR